MLFVQCKSSKSNVYFIIITYLNSDKSYFMYSIVTNGYRLPHQTAWLQYCQTKVMDLLSPSVFIVFKYTEQGSSFQII